jgi:hypothetical protein
MLSRVADGELTSRFAAGIEVPMPTLPLAFEITIRGIHAPPEM